MILNSKRVWAVVGAGYFFTTLCYLSADGSERTPALPNTSTSSRFDRLHPRLAAKNAADLHKRDYFARIHLETSDDRFARLYPQLAGQNGLSLHKRDHYAKIHLAASEDRFERQHPEFAKQNGANLHKRDHYAKIHLAASEDRFDRQHPEFAKQNGANLHKRDHYAKIHLPASEDRFDRQHPEFAKQNGANLQKRDHYAKIHLAASEDRFERQHPEFAKQNGANLQKRDHYAKIHLAASEDRFDRQHPEFAKQNGANLQKRDHYAKIHLPANEDRFDRQHPEFAKQNGANLQKRDHYAKIQVAAGKDRFERQHSDAAKFKGVDLHKIDHYAKIQVGAGEDRFDRQHPDTAKFKGVDLHKIDHYAKIQMGAGEDRFDRQHPDTSKFKGVDLHKIDHYAKIQVGAGEDRFDRQHPDTAKFKGVDLHKIDHYAKIQMGAGEDRFDRLHADTTKFAGLDLRKRDHFARMKMGEDRFDRLHPNLSNFIALDMRKWGDLIATNEKKGTLAKDKKKQILLLADNNEQFALGSTASAKESLSRFNRLHPDLSNLTFLGLRKWGELETHEHISIAKDSRKQAGLIADSRDRICNLFVNADSSKRVDSSSPAEEKIEEKGEPRLSEPYAKTRKNVGWQKVSIPDVFATGEFLWWQVREDGLDYAVSSNALPPPSGTGMIDGDVKRMPFGYDPGFRIGLGSIFGGNLWDLSLNWTRFHTQESVFHRAPVNGFLLPTKFVSFEDTSVFQGASHASARWRIKYDTISLELGRAFAPIRYLALRPHMGLTSGWIKQRASFEYDQIASPGVTLEVRDKNKFAGVGLRGGVNLRCPLGKGWSIFGDFAASLLWGRFHVHQKENQILSSGVPLERLNLRDKEHDVVSAIQAIGGVRWDRYFWKETTHLGLSLGYEFNEWFRQNRLMAFTEPNSNPFTLGNIVRNPGDLQFQGLTAGARFDF